MPPKTEQRLINFRRANRKMPKKRLDIPVEEIHYLNTDILKKFTTDAGKILPRRSTGMPAKVHRLITREIKRARSLNLMP